MEKEWTKKRLNGLNVPTKRTAKGRKKDNSFWHAKPQCAKNEQFIGRVFGHYVLCLIGFFLVFKREISNKLNIK